MNKQTITSICSLAALSAAMISPAYAAITATATSLDVNFNDAADSTDETTFKLINGIFAHSPTGGINGDGALDFPGNFRAVNWTQGLTGGVGTTITQSLVFTDNNLVSTMVSTQGHGVVFHMGFTNDVNGHVTDPTAQGGATADALQLQLYHNPSQGFISMALRPYIDKVYGVQKYSNFDYTGTDMLQFDLTLTRTGADTFDWGYVVTNLGAAGAGSIVMGSDTQSLTSADFGTSLNVGGVYAGLRSANQTAGILSGLDQWSVNVVPEPSAYALLAGALALGSVMMRRRRS
ncbi:MAG: PEP-CTERM sorting domain-containing protein [Puniceicoccaceae bacterium]|nr:PEP-CTERM sorting domain-containing protein [Puniceicoccaceae bacterium]